MARRTNVVVIVLTRRQHEGALMREGRTYSGDLVAAREM